MDLTKKRLEFVSVIEEMAINYRMDNDESGINNISEEIIEKIILEFQRKYDELFTAEMVKSPSDDPVNDNFRICLFKKYINKKDLFLNKKKYQILICMINSLEILSNKIDSKELFKTYNIYLNTFIRQIHIEFFYFFDLFYRQGNGKFYIKQMLRELQDIYEFSENSKYFEGLYESIRYYCIHNTSMIYVTKREELENFINDLKILDEIMGEIDFYNGLGNLYIFLNESMNGTETSEEGKKLYQKINN